MRDGLWNDCFIKLYLPRAWCTSCGLPLCLCHLQDELEENTTGTPCWLSRTQAGNEIQTSIYHFYFSFLRALSCFDCVCDIFTIMLFPIPTFPCRVGWLPVYILIQCWQLKVALELDFFVYNVNFEYSTKWLNNLCVCVCCVAAQTQVVCVLASRRQWFSLVGLLKCSLPWLLRHCLSLV